MYNRLLHHFESTDYPCCTTWFWNRYSTSYTIQLLSVFHQISQNLDSGKQTDILHIDIAKAFDTLDHKHLLKKLFQYGLSGNILNWSKDDLSGRRQRVLLNGGIPDSPSFIRCSTGIYTWTTPFSSRHKLSLHQLPRLLLTLPCLPTTRSVSQLSILLLMQCSQIRS